MTIVWRSSVKIGDLVFIQAGYDDYLRQVGVVLNVRTAALNSVVDVMCEDGVLSVEIDDLEVISEDR